MIKKLLVIVLILSPQKSAALFTTESPEVVNPPLVLPIIKNQTNEPIEVAVTYLYSRRINSLLLFGGRAQTTVDKIHGASIALEVQANNEASVPVAISFPSGSKTYTQDHLAGLQVTAHSASQQKLVITKGTCPTGTPCLQVQMAS